MKVALPIAQIQKNYKPYYKKNTKKRNVYNSTPKLDTNLKYSNQLYPKLKFQNPSKPQNDKKKQRINLFHLIFFYKKKSTPYVSDLVPTLLARFSNNFHSLFEECLQLFCSFFNLFLKPTHFFPVKVFFF
ncbi:hypothetical protein AABB24_033158 [Solanum stoloniferum]|uniref:Uncharacterized protein n=1 Tax=Solanum stoloniferum TaxID=62892 RepID=A0ABD2RM48_9SOLN